MTPDEIEADYLAQRQRLPFLDEKEMVEGFAATFARSLAERRERKASIALREKVRLDRWPRGQIRSGVEPRQSRGCGTTTGGGPSAVAAAGGLGATGLAPQPARSRLPTTHHEQERVANHHPTEQ